MIQKKSGQMECPRFPGKTFTWWYYEEMPRQRGQIEDFEDFPTPQFCYEGRDADGIPIIKGYCPVCGLVHQLDSESAVQVAEEFHLF